MGAQGRDPPGLARRTVNLSNKIIDAAWEHGRVMPEADAANWRQDACGAWIRRTQFGEEHSEFGWKIEQIGRAHV